MPTITETFRILQISRNTLRKRCKQLELSAVQSTSDGRCRELTHEQVETIRETLLRGEKVLPKPPQNGIFGPIHKPPKPIMPPFPGFLCPQEVYKKVVL